MSLLPIETIRAIQKNVDMVIEIYGMPCTLFIVKNAEASEQLSVQQEFPDYQFQPPIDTKIWVVFNPETKWLRNMGIFTEDGLPIIAFARSDHNIKRNSYFKINVNYAVGQDQSDEFEFVDHIAQKMYTSPIITPWKVAPRRK
jgi:hypothetical protein